MLGMLIICEIIAMLINIKSIKKINVYTQKGIDEKKQWRDFKKYMEDFSRNFTNAINNSISSAYSSSSGGGGGFSGGGGGRTVVSGGGGRKVIRN